MTKVSFPGFGIDQFEMNPVAFNIFGRDIIWYGIFISLGILMGVLYAIWRGKKSDVKPDDMIDAAIFAIPMALVGARLYFVLFNLKSYKTFMDVIAVWNGGLAVYGGIIFGLLTGIVVCRFKKISFPKLLDCVGPAIMIGQIIGRFGNFTNVEAFGSETTLPWRMGIKTPYMSNELFVHPTFLYEALWNLLGFFILNAFFKHKKYDGQIIIMYLTWYGFGRMLIEGLRTDSLYMGPLRISQIVGFVCFIIGLGILIFFKIKELRLKMDESKYESIYSFGKSAAKKKAVETVVEIETKIEEPVKENLESSDTEKENK